MTVERRLREEEDEEEGGVRKEGAERGRESSWDSRKKEGVGMDEYLCSVPAGYG